MRAIGKAEDWELRMRFDDRDSLSEFQDYCSETDIPCELNRIREQEQPMASAQYNLIDTTRNAGNSARGGLLRGSADGDDERAGGTDRGFPADALEPVSRRVRQSHREYVDDLSSGRGVIPDLTVRPRCWK